MRSFAIRAWAALALLAVATCASAAPFDVIIGPSRDGSLYDLQKKVDHLVGPGRIDVRRDYIGARDGDADPFFWTTVAGHAVNVTLLERKSPHGEIGWYQEGNAEPSIDGVHGGVVLESWRLRGSRAIARIPAGVTRFGFYVEHEGGDDTIDEGVTYHYYTDRSLNNCGPNGHGAIHEPYGGDCQALVYDVSKWMGPNTWLVACEYSDSGAPVGTGPGQTDNDYCDILFTVQAVGGGPTPTSRASFGSLKALWR